MLANEEQWITRWQEMITKLEQHPHLEQRFQILRPWFHNLQLEQALRKTGSATRFLAGSVLATVGLHDEESAIGWLGPGIQTLPEALYKVLVEQLQPLSVGEKRLLQASVEGTFLLLAYFCLEALRENADWKSWVKKSDRKEMSELYKMTGALFLVGSEAISFLFAAITEALGKKKSLQKRIGGIAGLGSILCIVLFLKEENEDLLEEAITEMQPALLQTIEAFRESVDAITTQETGASRETREWIGTVETLVLAWEKKEHEAFAQTIPQLIDQLGTNEEQFRKDVAHLRERMHRLTESITYALSRKEDVTTGIVQSA